MKIILLVWDPNDDHDGDFYGRDSDRSKCIRGPFLA